MAIGPLEFNGTIGRVQDFAAFKQNDDNRAATNQAVFQNQFDKEVKEKTAQVNETDESDKSKNHTDARDKGSNEYEGDGGKKRKKNRPVDGTVVVKNAGGFDMKV